MLIAAYLEAVADRLHTVDSLTVTTDPGAKITPPMALVTDGTIEYFQSFARGHDTLNLTITVYVSAADSAEGALEVRDYKSGYGAKSIRAALMTSTGAGDAIPNNTLIATSGDVQVIDRANGESYLALIVNATALLPGKES